MKKLLIACSIFVVLIVSGCDTALTTAPESTQTSTSPATVTTTAATPLTSATATTASPIAVTATVPALKLEKFDAGYFSIDKPQGWDIETAGTCSTFSFCIRDSKHPANQIFYFSEVGPVYLDDEQKVVDKNYMDIGGYPVLWYEMPVIAPLTPENFLSSFHLISRASIAQNFMPFTPELADIDIISITEEISPISGGQTKTIRALFFQDGELGEGLFYITVAPLIPLNGMPGGGIGYGFCVTGITSVRDRFSHYQETLTQSLYSLYISRDYIENCMRQQQQQYESILKAGRTLSETSDIIMDTWENRNRSDDIISARRSDSILGNDRVYDPDTGTVYQVNNNFYDDYNISRGNYRMNNLQLLPQDDWDLWTAPVVPGDGIE